MMSKEFLKKLGIFGVTMGLTASPFALAQQTQTDEDEYRIQPQTEQTTDQAGGAAETDATPARDVAPGVEPGDPAAPGIDPAREGEDPAMPGTEAEPGMMQDDDAGFGEGAQTMPGGDGTTAAPARETAPGVDPGDPVAPGIDPAREGEDPAMPGTEAEFDQDEDDWEFDQDDEWDQ